MEFKDMKPNVMYLVTNDRHPFKKGDHVHIQKNSHGKFELYREDDKTWFDEKEWKSLSGEVVIDENAYIKKIPVFMHCCITCDLQCLGQDFNTCKYWKPKKGFLNRIE
jgi:hypothetical protein